MPILCAASVYTTSEGRPSQENASRGSIFLHLDSSLSALLQVYCNTITFSLSHPDQDADVAVASERGNRAPEER
eukprot:scaffold3511_cov92-Cylindrotheca_fusiformis.AAC.5